MEKVYTTKVTRAKKDGTVTEYTLQKKYTLTKVPIPEDIKQKIVEESAIGVSIAKLSTKYNLSRYRVKSVIDAGAA